MSSSRVIGFVGRSKERRPDSPLTRRSRRQIVVRAIDTACLLFNKAGIGCPGAEPLEGHVGKVEPRGAVDHPFSQHLADAARAGHAMGTKSARRPKAGHLPGGAE